MFSERGIRNTPLSALDARSTQNSLDIVDSRGQRISGQDILDEMMRKGNLSEHEFKILCEELVDKWFMAYGFKLEDLDRESELESQWKQEPAYRTHSAHSSTVT